MKVRGRELSGTFGTLLKKLRVEDKAPKLIVLENVCGTLASHNGKDFSAICAAMEQENYFFGAIVMDAVDFLPQSRPRLFFIAVQKGIIDCSFLTQQVPDFKWHPQALIKAQQKLEKKSQRFMGLVEDSTSY